MKDSSAVHLQAWVVVVLQASSPSSHWGSLGSSFGGRGTRLIFIPPCAAAFEEYNWPLGGSPFLDEFLE